MYKRILVATDGSRLSAKAERAGIELARATGAELVAFSVALKMPGWMLSPVDVARGMDSAAVDANWLRFATDKAETLRAKAAKRGVAAEATAACAKDVAQAILAQAKRSGCDLIVMASHGRRGVERLLLGSETQHVLVHSELPVLVIR